LIVGHAFEIVGKVNEDLTVKVLVATDFGNDIGMCSSCLPAWLTNDCCI
jgi:hypothetical protein